MTRVAVDALGGDKAPGEVILGALEAAADGIEVSLYGPAGLDTQGLPLVETTEVIEMAEKPAEAVRAKPDSSLVACVRAVADGNADAVVSAGNTGAMLAAGLLHLRRLPGVMRPAIAVPLPARPGPERPPRRRRERRRAARAPPPVRPHGRVFSEEILDVHRPEVRLLSIGEEDEKGNQLTIEAHRLLREDAALNFAGNAESRDLLRGAADVVVTDGFTGNVALKLLEGTIGELLDALREEISSTATGKLGGLLIRPAARRMRKRLDPDTYGGAYLLGLRGPGRDRARQLRPQAIANAIRLAARGVEHRVSTASPSGSRTASVYDRPDFRPLTNIEVTWQRRVKRSSSASRKF